MSDYRYFEEERIGPENYWIVRILIASIVILFLMLVATYIGVGMMIEKEIQQKTAAANSGS